MPLRYWIIVGVYCALTLVGSLKPVPEIPGTVLHSDQIGPAFKVGHFFLYGGLAVLVALGIRQSGRPVSWTYWFLAPIIFASAFGAFCEALQAFVPYRNFEWWDMAANALGALTAQTVLAVLFGKAAIPRRRPAGAGEY